jgi:DNA polymerase III alpha subunit
MMFEEHILQIAVEFAGMNLGRADVLRRGLNKENRPLIDEMKKEFIADARRRGHTQAEIGAVWAILDDFAGFMFNKAHSAEYALEAFQGVWLKCRWPAHYLAAVLSNYRGFYAHSPTLPQILYVLEALRLGIRFLPPCVNRSRQRFAVESFFSHRGHREHRGETSKSQKVKKSKQDTHRESLDFSDFKFQISNNVKSQISNLPAIRVPVSHINGLSQKFIDRYWREREGGAFASLAEFVERCGPGEADSHLLLDSGALDGFGHSRPELFWQLRRLLRRGTGILPVKTRPGRPCHDLCHGLLDPLPEQPPAVDLTEPDRRAIARREMDLLGFPITIDPLTYLGSDDEGRHIDWPRYVPITQLRQHLGRRVQVCGIMVADRINPTIKGDLMKFVTLADRTGFVETLLFPDTYRKWGHLTVSHPILTATGIVEPFENRNGFTLRVQHLSPPIKSLLST